VVTHRAHTARVARGHVREIEVLAHSLDADIVSARIVVVAIHGAGDTLALDAVVIDSAGVPIFAQTFGQKFMQAGPLHGTCVARTWIAVVAYVSILQARAAGADSASTVCKSADIALLGTRVKHASRFRVAGIYGANTVVGTIYRSPHAREGGSLVCLDANLAFATLVIVVAACSFCFPLSYAGIFALRRLVVAPGLLTRVLSGARMLCSGQAVSILIAHVVIRTRVAILARSALEQRQQQVARTGLAVTRWHQTIVR